MRLRRIRAQAARREDRQDAGLTSVILALFAGLLAAAIAATPALSAERFELRGTHVAIYNLAGEVTLEPGSGPAVVVHVTRGGEEAGELDVRTGAIGDLKTLRIVYPSRRVHYRRDAGSRGSSTTVRVGDDGRFGDRDGSLSRNRVTISGGSGLDAHANLRVEVPKGQTLSLYLAAGEATARNTEGDLRIDVSAADVTTGGTRGDLLIDVGSGAVAVSGAEGSVNVDTGSGSVDLMKIHGDELLVDTGSGHVSAADVDVRRLHVDTGSGGVELGMVKAREVLVDTGSGRVAIDLTSDVESLNVDTGSGGVTIRMPEAVGAEISIDTGSGGIHTDLPIQIARKDRDTLRGRIGDGRGRIVIETGSGGVRLLKR